MSYPLKKLWEISLLINDWNYGWDYPKKEEFLPSWIPFLTAKNVWEKWSIRYDNIMYISKTKHLSLRKAQITIWDIIIVNRWAKDWLTNIASLIIDEKFIDANIWPQLTRIRANQKYINNKYLYYYFYTAIFKNDFEKVTSWSALKFVNLTKTKNFQIPLPPLPTQKAIVQKLDTAFEKIDASIELAQKNLENIEELGKSVMNETFTNGEMFAFEKICNKITDWSHNPPKWVEDGIPMISSRNLDDNDNVTFENIRFVDDENYIRENKRTDVEGDILLSIVWTIGKVAVVKSEYWKFVMQRSLAVLKLKSDLVDSFYMYYYLKSNNTQKLLVDWANWAAQKWIYLRDIKKIKIPLPPLEKQKEIVEYLDTVFEQNKRLKESYEVKIASLKEMKQSLLREAFEGRLVSE